LESGGFEPFMGLHMSVQKTDGVGVEMVGSQWINPTVRGCIDDPGSEVVIARVRFLHKHHRAGRLGDSVDFFDGRDVPLLAICRTDSVHNFGLGLNTFYEALDSKLQATFDLICY